MRVRSIRSVFHARTDTLIHTWYVTVLIRVHVSACHEGACAVLIHVPARISVYYMSASTRWYTRWYILVRVSAYNTLTHVSARVSAKYQVNVSAFYWYVSVGFDAPSGIWRMYQCVSACISSSPRWYTLIRIWYTQIHSDTIVSGSVETTSLIRWY